VQKFRILEIGAIEISIGKGKDGMMNTPKEKSIAVERIFPSFIVVIGGVKFPLVQNMVEGTIHVKP